MQAIISLLTAAVSLLFAAVVFDQYLERRRSYQLAWTVGILMYAAATGAEAAFWLLRHNESAFRLWYFFGAVNAAAYLGLGSVFLLARPWTRWSLWMVLGGFVLSAAVLALPIPLLARLFVITPVLSVVAVLFVPARVLAAILVLASIGAAIALFTAAVDQTVLAGLSSLTGEGVLPQGVRLMTPFFNIFGSVALVGGAAWSAWTAFRRQAPAFRFYSTLLIAVGGFFPSVGGLLARFGVPEPLALSLLFGIIIIFIGVLRASPQFGISRIPLVQALRQT